MDTETTLLICGLAICTFATRALGLLAGNFFQDSRFSWVLRELPEILIVAIVASSLTDQPISGWFSAAFALGVALYSNNVVLTMFGGVAAYALLQNIML